MKQVVGGDVGAFRRLFDGLAVPLATFLRKMGIDPATAEELAADALLKAHKSIQTFRGDGGAKLTTWVFQIARNCALDHLKATARERDGHAEFWLEFNRVAGVPADSFCATPELASKMQAAIARLDPADQDLLRQRLVMEYDEIAAQSGTAVGTLRVRHKRALDRLRREIGEG